MSHFNHAYKKMFLASEVDVTGSLATSALGAGEVGVVDASSYVSIAAGTAIPDEFLIVQGNLNTTDTLGGNPLHGGYAESIKSKIIKKNYVTALWSVAGVAASTTTAVTVYVPDSCYAANASPQLRVDLKGSEVLRSLNRNEYFIADATGCGASGDGDLTGLEVVTAWKDAINDDPIMSQFVTATVVDVVALTAGAGTETPAQLANLIITVDYAATMFNIDSFDTRDHYNTDPLTLIVSDIDDDGDACASTCIETAVRTYVDYSVDTTLAALTLLPSTGSSAVRSAATCTGEGVLRDLIQDGRYRQDGGHNQGNKDSNRFREVEKGKAIVDAVDVDALYTIYNIQHSVPRFNNPTGVFDNDQYIVSIAAKQTAAGTETAAMAAIMVKLEALTGLTEQTPLVD